MSLIVGVILTVVSSLFHPGIALINPVEQTDFPAAVGAMGDAPVLAHLMTLLNVLGMLLMCFGVLALFPLATRQGGLGGTFLRFGIFVSIVEWCSIVVGLGMRHYVAHLAQRAADAPAGSELQASLQQSALLVHTSMSAVLVVFVTLFPFASFFLGAGLISRFQDLNANKIASYGLALFGLGGLGIFMIIMFAGIEDPVGLLLVNNIFLFLGSICLLTLGIGMYKGQPGLAEEGSAS
ncbi:MAG: hypothetical protein F4Y02_07520 [Chloroflexi bacterium]|nr:hypothetical protein [Chloroflexota bacterium]